MTKRISIYRDGTWVGDGRIRDESEIVEISGLLGDNKEASDETYEIIQAIIQEDSEWKGSLQRPDGVYSWEIWDDTPRWTIQMQDENGVERHAEWPNMPSPQEVKDACEVQWHRMPAYMPQGAFLRIDYSVLDSDLEVSYTGSVEIDLDPDHTHLIGQACGERGCGDYHDMHHFDAPGRESDSQCRRCGLRKTWHLIGGHREVTYQMPSRNED